MGMKTLGRHLVIEMHGCRSDLLGDLHTAKRALKEALESCKATFMGEHYTLFPGGGISGIIVIAESHISIHTWPEHGYAAVDVFTCGEHVDPWKAYEAFVKNYSPARVNVMEIKRGIIEV